MSGWIFKYWAHGGDFLDNPNLIEFLGFDDATPRILRNFWAPKIELSLIFKLIFRVNFSKWLQNSCDFQQSAVTFDWVKSQTTLPSSLFTNNGDRLWLARIQSLNFAPFCLANQNYFQNKHVCSCLVSASQSSQQIVVGYLLAQTLHSLVFAQLFICIKIQE